MLVNRHFVPIGGQCVYFASDAGRHDGIIVGHLPFILIGRCALEFGVQFVRPCLQLGQLALQAISRDLARSRLRRVERHLFALCVMSSSLVDEGRALSDELIAFGKENISCGARDGIRHCGRARHGEDAASDDFEQHDLRVDAQFPSETGCGVM